jgi:hypothetical protein
MKKLILVIAGLVLITAGMAWSQQQSIYDNAYRGPRNYYGQPQFQPMPGDYGRRPQGRAAPMGDGLIFQGAHSVRQLGGYLWNYLPAPITGVKRNPFNAGTRGGDVIINFVPGSK